jgi:hypothetical protein
MTIETAQVDTLTAEVRVLMVGNRQITQSVAKQLDTVELREMEPFGRVHLSGRGPLVIGRDRRDGTLVTAWVSSPDYVLHEHVELHRRALALPLIVLAGLR